jgi:hypothetical protein
VLLHDAVNDLRCGIGVGDVQPDGVRCFPSRFIARLFLSASMRAIKCDGPANPGKSREAPRRPPPTASPVGT